MNETQNTPSLDRPKEAALPTRILRSPYFVQRTPMGGYYLDPAYNQNLVRRPDALAQFLAEAQRGANPACELGEVKYTARKNQQPLRYIHEGAIKEFEAAAARFLKSAATADNATLRQSFKLPDPAKEPDAYWVCGERFAPQLLILWGCEKEQHSSLPLIGEGRTVCGELRAKAMSWLRLFREGIELSRFTPDGQALNAAKDALGQFLAFPVLDAAGKVTHIDHFENGQYTRTPIAEKTLEFSKARLLSKLPGSEVARFAHAAREFYRAAHPAACACADCAGKPASNADPAKKPGTLSYQQELRQGFRLPDPDKHPEAFYVIGSPQSCKLFVLCPHPTVLDAEQIDQTKAHVEWQERKARTPEEIQAAKAARAQFETSLAQHNLYKRFFYEKDECLVLTADATLGLPVAAPKAAPADAMALPAPGAAPARASAPVETLVDKLMKRRINTKKIALIAGVTVGLVAGLAVAAFIAWPRHLNPAASISSAPALDPQNARNVIVVDYDNRLGSGLMGLTAPQPPLSACGKYTLRRNGLEVALAPVKTLSPKKVVFAPLDPSVSFDEATMTNWVLKIEGARDVWGNKIASTNVLIAFADKRSPSFMGCTTILSDKNDMIRLDFNEPMSQASLETPGNYAITGMTGAASSIVKATIQKDRKSVVLQADKPFQSASDYKLILSSNIVDGAKAANRLASVATNFVYATIPLAATAVSAAESQTRVRVEFNKPVDAAAAKAALKIDKLQIGEIAQGDAKSLELFLTNSAMLASAQYVLQIEKLKDLNAAGAELSTNAPFAFTGSADTNPPTVQDARAEKGGRVVIKFSKPLRRDSVEKAGAFTLTLKDRTEPLAQAGLPVLVSPDTVNLRVESELEKGDYVVKYTGIQDIMDNKGSGSASLAMRKFSVEITALSALNIDGDTFTITLSKNVDPAYLENSAKFTLEDENGNPAGIEVAYKSNTKGQTSREIALTATPKPNPKKFYRLHCVLKALGESTPQELYVSTPTSFSRSSDKGN